MRTSMSSAVILGLLIVLASPLVAQDKSDAAIIRSLELKWTESYRQRQVGILSSLLADDFVITIEDGSTYSKTGYMSHSAEPSVHVEVAEMSDLKVRMHGNTAVVTGAYHERGESKGKRYEYHDRLTDVWMKNCWPMASGGIALQRAREVVRTRGGHALRFSLSGPAALALNPASAAPNTLP